MSSYFVILWNETFVTTVASKRAGLGKCGCDLLCFPSPTVNECSLYHTLIIRHYLEVHACLCMRGVCADCVYRMSLKKERKCVWSVDVLPPPMKQRVIFAFLEGPCEAVKLFTELKMYVMFSVSVHFFVNTTPFGRGSNALPYLDSRVTWVYSWILNRNKKTA